MKKIISTFLIILVVVAAMAQQDPEAKKILDKLSEKTKSHEVISTNFKVTFKSVKDNIENSSEGTIVIKGDKYRLNFMSTEAFFDGKTLWNYLPEVNEVNITEPKPDDEDIFNNPKRLFTIYEDDYKYQLIGTSTKNNTNYAIVDLYPKDIDQDYSRIRLQINTSKYYLSSATVFGKDGSNYTIRIEDFKTNEKFDDEYFTFETSKYPDVEVIDMRF